MSERRDMTPAVGTPGEPGRYRRAVKGAAVALAGRAWADARWSYLYRSDTAYATEEPDAGEVAEAARRMRTEQPLEDVRGPIVKAPVWPGRCRSTSGSAGSPPARRSPPGL